MPHRMSFGVLLTMGFLYCLVPAAHAKSAIERFPWLVKSQKELTYSECKAARRHDLNYWWSRGSCHMKAIRYAAGVVLRDTAAQEHEDSIREKGEILQGITQYRPYEGVYCEHGGYCYNAKDVKLLGSMVTGPYSELDAEEDETDRTESVGSSCELLIADRKNILKFKAEWLLEGCR